MSYTVVEKDNRKYLKANSGTSIKSEDDVLDLIAACWESDVSNLMLFEDNLSAEFFKLSTGLAGQLMQKLINYQIKAALIIPDPEGLTDRFKEWALELNKGKEIRIFRTVTEAESWLK